MASRWLATLVLWAGGLISLGLNAYAQEPEWIPLFNGKDLSGWKVGENPQSVRVEDGQLVVNGPRAHAFYVGDDGAASFRDFHFHAEVMTMPGANSGIYFHSQYQSEGWPNTGYEAQVNNTQGDPRKTGGLYAVKDNFSAPVGDKEWFTYEIIVQGRRITIKINGRAVTDYTEPSDLDRPERHLSEGTFALQAHDPGSKVYFRNLKVKRL
jgi:hypothetical protein